MRSFLLLVAIFAVSVSGLWYAATTKAQGGTRYHVIDDNNPEKIERELNEFGSQGCEPVLALSPNDSGDKAKIIVKCGG